jgi:hypothetical protein
MNLTFQNFKQTLSAQILERGRSYQRSGHIIELEMDGDSNWSAVVSGTEDYEVEITQSASGALTCTCTCPYDLGPYCKHMAAVLYAIEETFSEYVGTRKGKAPAAKRETKENKLHKALQQASREELLEALLDLAKNKTITNQLLLRFGAIGEDKDSISKVIKDAIRGYSDHGFFDYNGSRRAGRAIGEYVERAAQMLAQGKWNHALNSYLAVLETVIEIYHASDDSDGELGVCIADALEGLESLAEVANPDQHTTLFTTCLNAAQDDRYAGMDARWDLFQLATNLVTTPQERETLFSALDIFEKPKQPPAKSVEPQGRKRSRRAYAPREDVDSFISRYDAEHAGLLKLSIIERQDDSAAVEQFIGERVHLDKFRQLSIERSLKRNDLAQAKALIADGIAINQKTGYAGLVSQYRQYLQQIAQREGDTSSVVKIARELFLNGRDNANYDVLKANVKKADWPAFLTALIRDAKKSWGGTLAYWIQAREGMWCEMLADADGLWNHGLEAHRLQLEKHCGDEVVKLYEQMVYTTLKSATSRGVYQSACQLLRRMQKLGKSTRVKQIVEELKVNYPQRKALLEELAKI